MIDALLPEVLLVLDEAYFEYADDPDYPDGLDYVRAGAPVVVLRTFSKVYGLAGLRVGYGVAAPEVVEASTRSASPSTRTLSARPRRSPPSRTATTSAAPSPSTAPRRRASTPSCAAAA